MPALTLTARLRSALPGPRTRRVLGWIAVVVLMAGAGGALIAYAVAGVPPSDGTRVLIGGAGLAAGALMYALPRARTVPGSDPATDAVGTLWRLTLMVIALLVGVELAPAIFGEGSADAAHIPSDLMTALGAVFYTTLHLAVSALILRWLRPLVLARPTRRSVRVWRAFVGLIMVAALARLLAPAGDNTFIHFIAAAAVALLMTACAFMQGWIVPLPSRLRLRAGGFAILLAIALGVTMGESFTGPGAVPILSARSGGAGEDTEQAPYAFLLSPAIGDAVAMPMAFGLLYGITSALTLLFSLPSAGAYAQRAGEVRVFRALSALTLDPAQGLDRGRLATAVARAPVEAGIARAAWVALADPSRGTLAPIVVSSEGISVDAASRAVDAAALALDALDQGRPLVLTRAAADHRVRARPGDGIGSLVVLPLAAGGQGHGALFAARATPDAFDEDETAAMEAFAGQAALALSHAALFDEALERERLARELALARDVQRRLVPEQLPAVRGASISARMTSAHEVCGDYYDVADLGGGCFGFLVADVAGKGAVAAFHMAQLKGIFQASAALSKSPGAFLARANEALRPSLGPRSFVSAVYAVLNPDEGTLTVARAGHCPAVLVREGTAWPLRAPGLGLGLDAGPLFRKTLVEQVVPLRPGDVVAIYTDGLIEARDDKGDEFGYDRLNGALLASAGDSGADAARHVRDRLFAEMDSFADASAAVDDTTLLVIAWHGEGTPAPARTDGPPFHLRPAFEPEQA